MAASLMSLLNLAGTPDPLIVICGEPHTGKSHLLQVWESDAPPQQPSPIPLSLKIPAPTQADPNASVDVEEISEVRSYLRLDVINQRMRARNDELLKKADVALICVDVNRKGSMDAVLNRWYDEEIRPRNPKLPIALVLTHTEGNLSQISISMDHHVQPAALTIPALRIFTAPNLTSRAQVEPIFEWAVHTARNPRQAVIEAEAARESLGGSVEVVHLGPAGSACGMFLLGQVKGLAELKANARSCNEKMEDVVRRIVKVVGKDGLDEVGAGDLLPAGVAGDLILGNIAGAASGEQEAQEEIKERVASEKITVEELAARVVRAVGRDAADRLGLGHLLQDPSMLPGTPRMERTLGGRPANRSDSRSSGRYSAKNGESPRPPSSLGKVMGSTSWRGEYDEEPQTRRSFDSTGDRSTVAADHEHVEDAESWTEKSDETAAGSHPGSSGAILRTAYNEDQQHSTPVKAVSNSKLQTPASAVPVPLPFPRAVGADNDSRPPSSTDTTPLGTSPRYDSHPRRVPSNPTASKTPRAAQQKYDKGAFVDRLDRLALDDALEDVPVPPPPSPSSRVGSLK